MFRDSINGLNSFYLDFKECSIRVALRPEGGDETWTRVAPLAGEAETQSSKMI